MTGSEVVEPERIDVIDDRPGENILTLVSCYISDGSDHIIVNGKLVEEMKYEELGFDL